MIRRQHVIQEFFDKASQMRSSLDDRFRQPYMNGLRWEYFCDPKLYTYLRCDPREALPADLFNSFTTHLKGWCLDNLGLVPRGIPTLHLMVNGCKLGLHSDFHNGALGYVFSLTRWDNRRFEGGETLLLRDGTPSYKKHHAHGEGLYELVPANFNQLLVFDDRLIHATPVIEGSMDPLEGRIALVGHIVAGSPVVAGTLDSTEVRRIACAAWENLKERLKAFRDVQGTITYRLLVSPLGRVDSATILTDTVVIPAAGYQKSEAVDAVKGIVHQVLMRLKFPESAGVSSVILPILIPLPEIAPIKVSASHDAPLESLRRSMSEHMEVVENIGIEAVWREFAFEVSAPIAGAVRIDPKRVTCEFDPPMWVPSQRAAFEAALDSWLIAAVKSA